MDLGILGLGVRTGGCSSSFSPRSGLAFRFAKTPSLEEEKGIGAVAPLPGRALVVVGGAGVVSNRGSSVILRSKPGAASLRELPLEAVVPVGRIKRCLSSLPASSSSSEPAPSSKVSANVLSTSPEIREDVLGCRDAGDEALDRKEGGGDEGIGAGVRSSSGVDGESVSL